MKMQRHERGAIRIAECLDPIGAPSGAHELVSACVENDSRHLLIDDRQLPPEFFDLRSRLAGELIQKLQNYHVKLAIVFSDVVSHGERFEEFVREARRGSNFRTFDDREAALTWLASG